MRTLLFGLFSSTLMLKGAGVLEVRAPGYGWTNAEYTTSHVYIDEVLGTSADIEIRFDPQAANVVDVEVFTNLNRRDLADGDKNMDGEHDGIIPPDGSLITDSAGDTDPDTGHYYIPHNMSFDDGQGLWTLTIPAVKTGAYRLTARFKKSGDPDWTWYGLRDHCVVVTPQKARDMRVYEINVFNVEASGTLESQRSTWEDLHDHPDAIHATPGRANDWNLDYITELGVNWLWFQPYHPYGIDGRDTEGPSWLWNGGSPFEDSNLAFDLGSPYAVKNFWEIEPRTSANYDGGDSMAVQRSTAMSSFVNFVESADAAGISLMPDAAFNHAAFDVELGQMGVDLWSGGAAWSPTDEIRNQELRVFSREDDYYQRAGLGPGEGIAPAPDRYDFGKWNDVRDFYFGRYAALWRNSGSSGQQNDEGDWFDYTTYGFNGSDGGSFDSVTRGVWKYFAEYAPYWVGVSRPAGENRNSAPSDGDLAARYAFDERGIDGLRCDFAQGIPPQAWEYIINRARSQKWCFVFMAESLDGGAVTYRSGRHFDVLNENAVFAVKNASTKWDLSTIYEDRRTAYGEAMILLNTVSHDEENYADSWRALSRYAANCAIGGAPMIFNGQELGLADFFGFDLMEVNFGKYVPHFKTHNSMMPLWSDVDFGNDQLFKVYAGMNTARANSLAIQTSNRWFIDGDGFNGNIFAVVKYEESGVPTKDQDVVMAFVNLDRNSDQTDNYKIPSGLAPLIGLDDSRLYNIMNVAAYERPPAIVDRRTELLWPVPMSGADLKSTGFGVFMKKVPTTALDWDTAPYEAQYLKLIDVTDPLSVSIASIGRVGNDVALTCSSEVGLLYHLQTSLTLTSDSWTTLEGNVVATGNTVDFLHAGGAGDPERFYRVRVSYGSL